MVHDLMPSNVPQTAMALLKRLRQLISLDARQGRQPEDLHHKLSKLHARGRSPINHRIPNDRVAGLEQARVAPLGDILERDEGCAKTAVCFKVSGETFVMSCWRLHDNFRLSVCPLVRLGLLASTEDAQESTLWRRRGQRWWNRAWSNSRCIHSLDLGDDVRIFPDFDRQSELQLAMFNAVQPVSDQKSHRERADIQFKFLINPTFFLEPDFRSFNAMNSVIQGDGKVRIVIRQRNVDVSQTKDWNIPYFVSRCPYNQEPKSFSPFTKTFPCALPDRSEFLQSRICFAYSFYVTLISPYSHRIISLNIPYRKHAEQLSKPDHCQHRLPSSHATHDRQPSRQW